METFGDWLQKCQGDKNIGDELYFLARQPTWHVLTCKGYEINRNTFYTISQDKKSTNQNSGVRVDAKEPNGDIHTYYGRIKEIWELDYAHNFKVPLFRCQWVKLTEGGVLVDKEYGMAIVDLNNIGYRNDPFVLAADVNQVFYVKDMSTKPKRGKHDEKNQRAKAPYSSYREKTSWELKTSQTCQRIIKRMNESTLLCRQRPKHPTHC